MPLPHMVAKPWGSERWWAHISRYAGKILRVTAGHRLSVRYRRSRDETSYLLSGRLLLLKGEVADALTSREVHAGEAWGNRPGEIHTIEALEDCERPSTHTRNRAPTTSAPAPPARSRRAPTCARRDALGRAATPGLASFDAAPATPHAPAAARENQPRSRTTPSQTSMPPEVPVPPLPATQDHPALDSGPDHEASVSTVERFRMVPSSVRRAAAPSAPRPASVLARLSAAPIL